MNKEQEKGFWNLLLTLSFCGIFILTIVYTFFANESFWSDIGNMITDTIPSLVAVLISFIVVYILLSRFGLDNSGFMIEKIKKEVTKPLEAKLNTTSGFIVRDYELRNRENSIKNKEEKYSNLENLIQNVKHLNIDLLGNQPIEISRKDLESRISTLEIELKGLLKKMNDQNSEKIGKEITSKKLHLIGLQKALNEFLASKIAVTVVQNESKEIKKIKDDLIKLQNERRFDKKKIEDLSIKNLQVEDLLKRYKTEITSMEKRVSEKVEEGNRINQILETKNGKIRELTLTIQKLEKQKGAKEILQKFKEQIDRDYSNVEKEIE